MTCKLCSERGKTWEGDDPTCGFDEGGFFKSDNWCCATLNKLRDLAKEFGWNYRDDCDMASIGVIPFTGNNHAGYIILTWYKDRGRTSMAVFMQDGRAPVFLNLQMAEEAIEYYEGR